MLKLRRIVTVDNPTTKPLLDESTNFAVKSIKVDNYSGHWMRVDPDGVFVPPFTIGMIIDLFVQAQRVGIYSARPPGIGIQSGATELDGQAIISAYDEPAFPFPGTYVAQPFVQRVNAGASLQGAGDILPALPADFTPIQMTYSFPLFWAAADNVESMEHIQARQTTSVESAEQVCAAGVPTNMPAILTPDDIHQRLMWFQIGTDTSGEVLLDFTSGSTSGLFRGYLMPGFNPVNPMPGNGFYLAGSAASRFRATHDVGGTVYLTVGLGHL